MADATIGPGDVSANDYGISSGIFYVNWGTSTVASGGLGRIHGNMKCRWGCGGVPGNASGHVTLWNSVSRNRVVQTNTIAVTTLGTGTFNVGTAVTTWVDSQSFYGGYFQTSHASNDQSTPFKDGTGGNYAGKPSSGSVNDDNNSGGTTNWAGVGSPGGLGWSATIFRSDIWVRRAGAWTQTFVYVRRSGAWTQTQVFVRRSSAWTTLNYLEEYGIPEKGLPVEVNVGEGWEPGFLTEGPQGWFGSVDPTTYEEIDLLNCPPGAYDIPFFPYTGRFNSIEPKELIEERLEAHYNWDRALRWENYKEAGIWYPKWQSDNVPIVKPSEELVLV